MTSLDDAVDRVKHSKFVFIDESTVLTYNLRDDCRAVRTNTGKFNNEWAFGTQPHSPYSKLINHRLDKPTIFNFSINELPYANDNNVSKLLIQEGDILIIFIWITTRVKYTDNQVDSSLSSDKYCTWLWVASDDSKNPTTPALNRTTFVCKRF